PGTGSCVKLFSGSPCQPRASRNAITPFMPSSSIPFSYRSASHSDPHCPFSLRGTHPGSSGGPATVTGGSCPFATRVLLISGTPPPPRPTPLSPPPSSDHTPL